MAHGFAQGDGMNQEQFVAQHEAEWRRLEGWIAQRKKPAAEAGEKATVEEFAGLYRRCCQHLALARSRLYSFALINRLNNIVIQSHARLYGARRNLLQDVARYILQDFPAHVRAHWRPVLASAALFYLSMLAVAGAIQIDPDMVYSVMDGNQLRQFEYMYDPAHLDSLGRRAGREADSDLMMFGFYVRNNTGIGFRTFASGLFFGLGSVATLLFNGVQIGAAAGHMTHLGYIRTFWGFVAGHSALELNAIVLSGAAGFVLGMALLAPGRRTRLRALREEAKNALLLMYGAAGMFILAAMVEAFWSPARLVPPEVKYLVGIGMWVMVLGYFIAGGRRATR
jgi:uncharacterized membrane protein SpoIIM required for sporulation